MRFACEVAESVRTHWPDDKPLFLRLSAEDDAGWGPAQSVAPAARVKPLGVDPRFSLAPPASQYWLERRAVTASEVRPSTFGVSG